MKKLFITSIAAVAMLAAAAKSNAQGTVWFNEGTAGACITSNTMTGVTAKIAAGQFNFGLYVGSTAAAAAASTTPVLVITNTGFAGVISGTIFTVQSLSPSTQYFFEVKGWTASYLASSYEAALQTSSPNPLFAGVSQTGTFTTGGGPNSPSVLFGTGTAPNQQVPNLVLTQVPEPSTMVLGGLGVAALAFFRRRK